MKIKAIILSALLLAVLAACDTKEEKKLSNKEPPLVESQPLQLNPIDDYFLALSSWQDISPSLPDDPGSKKGNPKPPVKEGAYECVVQDYSLTKTPESIVLFSDSPGELWPGSLIQTSPYIDGKFEQLPIAQLAPTELTINLATAQPSIKVDNPTNASMQSAISTLIARAEGTPVPAKATYSFKEAYSVEQLLLDFNLSAKYMNQSAKASLSINKNVETKNISAYFVQNMFTVSVPAPVTPSKYFANISMDEINDQQDLGRLGKNNPPLYVSSITYGRLLMFNLSSTASTTDIQAALDYAYTGGADIDTEAKAKYKGILSSAQINVVPFGGPWQEAAKLIRSANIKDYFSDTAPPLTTAVPISYKINTLARGKQARVSETTTYSQKNCQKAKSPAIAKNAQFTLQYVGGGDNRYYSKAEWFQVGLEGKRPYPTLQLSPVKLLFRGNKKALTSGTNIRFSTLEKKAGGKNLDKKIILGSWSAKKYVSYLDSNKGPKQNWIFTKKCAKKCPDSYIRYGDQVHIRSEYKPKKYLCNDSDKSSHWLITKAAKCTWKINK